MHLTLHIGAEKTGSTSIQETLFDNLEALSEQSIFVPQSLKSWGHHARLYTLFKPFDYSDEFLESELCSSQHDRPELINKWKDDFCHEIGNARAGHCIISSEFLHSRLSSAEEINQLRLFLDTLFSSYTIIIYIRNQIEAAASLVSTAVRGFGASYVHGHFPLPGSQAFVDLGIHFKFNYEQTIQLWRQAFHDSTVQVCLYDPETLAGGCVVTDFLKRCGISDHRIRIASRKNESLGVTALSLLSSFNKIPTHDLNDTAWYERKAFLADILKFTLDGSRRYQPDPEAQLQYEKYFADSNEWVRSNYFPERSILFPKRDDAKASTSTFQIDPQDCDSVALAFDLILRHVAAKEDLFHRND